MVKDHYIYLRELITLYKPTRDGLHSSDQNLLVILFTTLKRFAVRSFTSAAPALWNDLPPNLRSESSLLTFKKGLKNNLYHQAFNIVSTLYPLPKKFLLELNCKYILFFAEDKR